MALRILLISDNGSFTAHLCKLLTSAGHAPFTVPEGKDPLKLVRQEKPELVIVAVEASKVSGFAVEQRLHTPDGIRKIPVIVICDDLRLEAELLHLFDFIPKPLDAGRLLDDVAAIARRPLTTNPVAALTDPLYREFSSHILSCTGLQFESRNRSALERGIGKRMSALRIDSCSDYLDYLKRHGESRNEFQKLLQFLTVGETYFFRYPSHFEAFKAQLSQKARFPGQPIRIWSAGCSTGEEAYSLAISVMEALPDWKSRDIRIIATDINERSLARAREGVYTQWALRNTHRRHLDRYFDHVAEGYRIRDEVKQLVQFFQLNLLAHCDKEFCSELQKLDAIFCRNVLIYFSPDPASRLVQRFSDALKASGQLFLGHAEALFQRSPALEICRQEESFFYIKSEAVKAIVAQHAIPEQRAPLRAVAAPPKHPATAAARLEAARERFDAEDLDAAYALVEAVLQESPEETGALILKGFIRTTRGDFREALECCSMAIALNDLLPEAYFLKGMALEASGRLTEAADEYRKALLLDHNFIMPRFHMGRLHLRLGRVVEAVREIRNSIKILSRHGAEGTVPYSGGLTRALCMEQLQNALSRVA